MRTRKVVVLATVVSLGFVLGVLGQQPPPGPDASVPAPRATLTPIETDPTPRTEAPRPTARPRVDLRATPRRGFDPGTTPGISIDPRTTPGILQ